MGTNHPIPTRQIASQYRMALSILPPHRCRTVSTKYTKTQSTARKWTSERPLDRTTFHDTLTCQTSRFKTRDMTSAKHRLVARQKTNSTRHSWLVCTSSERTRPCLVVMAGRLLVKSQQSR